VQAVPNAEPLAQTSLPSCHRPLTYPLKFLLQGRVVPGRGIEELLDAWRLLEDSRAVLILRVPPNAYLSYLCSKYRKAIDKGHIILASPVEEAELVTAASSADVGVIPYPGPNLNHVYACPNKLSQYMQAGLAILGNADLEFVSEIINRQQCGVIYKAAEPDTLMEAVHHLIQQTDRLQAMKTCAYEYARVEFNWEKQSESYKKIIEQLFQRGQL
jgi:glycosyltransferase involved in cell wall biosynthesis